MFRRLSNTLPKDPEFPADFEKLGYFINSSDQIRSIAHPTQEFNFFISKNERVCEVQREAFNTCVRTNLLSRFKAAGLEITRLSSSSPLNPSSFPPAEPVEPHIPLLTTPNLPTASRILVYFGENNQDLGIFAHRTISKHSLASGSVLELVSSIKADSDSSLKDGQSAIVIANPGQLVWYRRGARAMTVTSWNALPRKTGVGSVMRMDPVKNHVPGHRTAREHVGSVMKFIGGRTKEGAKVEVVGVGEGGEEVVRFLDENWKEWSGRVAAVCVGLAFLWKVDEEIGDEGFKDFWGKRARAYLLHSTPLSTPLYGREEVGCNCYSSGEDKDLECIMPKAYTSMLDFFQLVHNLPGYEEKPILVEQEADDSDRYVSWETAGDQEMVEKMQRAMIEVSKAE